MKWKGRRQSEHVRDYRGKRVRGAGGGNNALGLLFNVGSRFGIKGILVAVVLAALLWKTGLVDPGQLLGGAPGNATPVAASAAEQQRFEFVKVVLADTEDVWNAQFDRRGKTYREPVLVVFRGRVNSGCGAASAASGPFYCPADERVYIDLAFYDELEQSFEAPGDFAQAYVIAHEIGHHVQNLLGVSDRVNAMRTRDDFNEVSVRQELQADFYAGLWAHYSKRYLERGDIEEAVKAANAIGDDAIQGRLRGKVLPHTFTHGTSEQRMRWFKRGLESGRMEDGDTFRGPYNQL